ncbi:T9SS type B sorting domain-containing protein [Mesonia aestuariivivens]|uniref:T9SS type B sorting domain-containing protein n=1 Tax=Mesonia aestuariivivens TaxID=2796128 RepID=A0ABS6VXV1_9FLAO|nr:choice-of-anchor L domain-containing protein [Mesonia aestuariivivens]MBW2960412.1 T9SS type B sorting domain-containing protein [Mesonia aestuariivivens]
MKKILPRLILFFSFAVFSQTVTIPAEQKTATELVNVLFNNACIEISNARFSSAQSATIFNGNGSNFPLNEGVIIRSGNAQLSQGQYTGIGLSSQINNNSDANLVAINTQAGQSSELTDVAFLEFDFVPLSSDFNFNFLFASNEYGQWQCLSSDVFAFLLTNLETNETQNLALIPNTNIHISVNNIKDNTYNSSCDSDYPNLFDVYNVDDPNNSTVNMRGFTKVLTASSTINPGTPYRIRLVIADSNDANFDSAIFLEAGSFDSNIDLGENVSICDGDSEIISTELDPDQYNHIWMYNGEILDGETGSYIQATQSGTYEVSITKTGNNCMITEQVEVMALSFQEPEDIKLCNADEGNNFDLTVNSVESLDVNNENYVLHYFASQENLDNLNPIPDSEISSYESEGNQTIYIKLYNTITGNYCTSVGDFNLIIGESIDVNIPESIDICIVSDNNLQVSLNGENSAIVSPQDPLDYTFSYFISEEEAFANENPIMNYENYSLALDQSIQTFWVRVQALAPEFCFELVPLTFQLNEPPPVSELEDVIECDSFVLPEIEHGDYYSLPDGGGQQYTEGYEVTESQTIYIFNGPDENGCTNQSSFKVSLIVDYSIELVHCESFKIPFPPAGQFYDDAGGANGGGELLPSGTIIDESQIIYFYAEIDGEFCREKSFDIEILPLPPVDELQDIVTCSGYVLPALENGNYYTQENGAGIMLSGGDQITQSKTYYIYNEDNFCENQSQFNITILPEFQDLVVCGGYQLPQLSIGDFFTEASGLGEVMLPGTFIEESQTIYYYAETTTMPNCTNSTSFNLEVKPIPLVDSLVDVLLCENEDYTLPQIANGDYFTQAGRNGELLAEGSIITSSQTIFINNEEDGCENETSFAVEIRDLPEVPSFTDIHACHSYELPQLQNGEYYTESLAQGEQLFSGDLIEQTQIIFIYNEYEDLQGCYNEDFFTIYIDGLTIEEVEDIYVCDSYVLPSLNEGNYYTQSGGQGNRLNPGYAVTSDREIFIYGKTGDRFICETEVSFKVYVVKPDLSGLEDIERCGDYTLPSLSDNEIEINYYWEAGAQNKLNQDDLYFDQPGVKNVFVYAYSVDYPECFEEKEIQITIYERPQLYVEGGTLCRNVESGDVESPVLLTTSLETSDFQVNWYLNGNLVATGPEYEAFEAGTYEALVEKLTPEVGADCNYLPAVVEVKESAIPKIKLTVTEPFKDEANINIEILNGLGTYLYSLDGVNFQKEPTFYNVDSGVHTVEVKGEYGNCGSTVQKVDVIKFIKFFTPNQDGFNDTWNIKDLKFDPNASISIFDRFGKLLTTISPSGLGWNGSYNGKNMPSNDYWFLVDYDNRGEKRQFKSHFTLKR